MKRHFFVVLTMLIILTIILVGCEKKNSSSGETIKKNLDAAKTIQDYLDNHIMPELTPMLVDAEDKPLTVGVSNGKKASITVRVFAPYYIPYVAEKFIPVAQEAIKEADVELEELSLRYYMSNNFGAIDGTMTNWKTTNWEKGTFFIEGKEGKKDAEVRMNTTIGELFDYYAEYDELVQKILSGEYDK